MRLDPARATHRHRTRELVLAFDPKDCAGSTAPWGVYSAAASVKFSLYAVTWGVILVPVTAATAESVSDEDLIYPLRLDCLQVSMIAWSIFCVCTVHRIKRFEKWQ